MIHPSAGCATGSRSRYCDTYASLLRTAASSARPRSWAWRASTRSADVESLRTRMRHAHAASLGWSANVVVASTTPAMWVVQATARAPMRPNAWPGPTTVTEPPAPSSSGPSPFWPAPDMPPHQQSEQAVLGRTGQKLIDQGLTVAQGEQRASSEETGLGGRWRTRARSSRTPCGQRSGREWDVSDCAFSERSSPCDSTRWRCREPVLVVPRACV